jgi:lipoyl synthase
MRKPEWLNKKKNLFVNREMKELLRINGINTVCENSSCPNISECFKNKTATFMIMGNICTRACLFCGVTKGKPEYLDLEEPKRISNVINKLGLKYVVITCVTRDDLKDKGIEHFCNVIKSIKTDCASNIKIELLTSDFYSSSQDENMLKFELEKILNLNINVFGHNLETVKRIYPLTRKISDYSRSLNLLKIVKKINSKIITKSSLMLGLGETKEEIIEAMENLREVNCDILTLGQYLSPSRNHYPVEKYITLEEFENLKIEGKKLGFLHVESGPYVRSSYRASEYI